MLNSNVVNIYARDSDMDLTYKCKYNINCIHFSFIVNIIPKYKVPQWLVV